MTALHQDLQALSAWEPFFREEEAPPPARPKLVALPARKPNPQLPFGSK